MDNIKSRMVTGAVWVMLERFSIQAVGFLVTMVLARLLTPTDYGTVALLAIFVSIAGTLVDAGFGEALIQKKEATDLDFNTVFYFSVALSGVAYLGLFVSAPFIAKFYEIPELCPILRTVSLTIVFQAVNSVQNAELNRKLKFNLSFRITCASSLVSAAIGVMLAFWGYGPWALVWQTVSASFSSVVLAWWFIHWRPKLMFSFHALRGLFRFGWKLAFSLLLDGVFNNISGALIGKFYTRADLAFVDKGKVLPRSLMSAIAGSLERVTFPVFAQMQDNTALMKIVMRRVVKISTFAVFPLMTGCAVCADRLVLIMFGDQWINAIPYVRLVCLQLALLPFTSVNLRVLLALGRSDIFLKLEIIKKVIGISLMALSLPHGVFCFVLVSALVSSPLGAIVNSWPNKKLLDYFIFEQIKDVLPNILTSSLMGAICYGVGLWLPVASLTQAVLGLAVQMAVGILVYFALAIWITPSMLREVFGLLGSRMPRCLVRLGRFVS